LYTYKLILHVPSFCKNLCKGYAQCPPQRIQIFASANFSQIILKFFISGITKENTPILSVETLGHTSSTFHFNASNLSRAYFTNTCSLSKIFSIPQREVIYSIAFKRLTAPIRFGVPASNLSELPINEYHSVDTSSIVPPPTIIGVRFFIYSFLRYTTPIPVYAIILCPVNTKQSQSI